MKKSWIKRGPKRERKPSLNHQDRAPEPEKKPKAKKRARIKPVSDRQKKLNAAYNAAKAELGNGPHICWITGQTIFIGVNGSWHHPSGRRTLRTILFFKPTLQTKHDWIHANESEALRLGYLTREFFRSIK